MTVMVTGASGLLGRAIVQALAPRDEVRATVRRPEAGEALRLLGAKVAVLPIEEPDELIEILPRVHTIVHLVGGANQPSDEEILAANHRSTLAMVAAAKEGGVRRLILLSVPGAAIDHPHPFLRAKGLAEEVVVHSGLEYAVLRSSHAYGLGGLWFAATVMGAEHGFVVGDGWQRHSTPPTTPSRGSGDSSARKSSPPTRCSRSRGRAKSRPTWTRRLLPND
jgi:uncharacterized protein YbjT (DUF2867 family)